MTKQIGGAVSHGVGFTDSETPRTSISNFIDTGHQ